MRRTTGKKITPTVRFRGGQAVLTNRRPGYRCSQQPVPSSDTNESMTETEDQLQREAQQWLIRLTSGQATTSDAAEFRRWCALSTDHAQAFANARQLWQALGPAAQQIEKTESSESQGAAHSASEIVPLPQRRMGRRAFLTGAVAASAAFVFVRPSFMARLPAC